MNKRIGECITNNNKEKMVIVNYVNSKNIDVFFPKYNYTNKNKTYAQFKNGNIGCPYTKNVYDVGYIGDGDYKAKENGKITKIYDSWRGMIRRCYSKENNKSHITYRNVAVCEEWHNFQNFAKWYEDNYYEVDNERMELDKDILVKGNKIYSPDTCVFVPQCINKLFTKSNYARGKYYIGVTYSKKDNKYISTCKTHMDNGYLGIFNSEYEAFCSYKKAKEEYVKYIANEYKNRIPKNLYDAMITYEVEITD